MLETKENQSDVDMRPALSVVFRILEKWGCEKAEQMTLLGLNSLSKLNNYKQEPVNSTLSPDLLERMSHILSIHKSLRLIFSDDDSVYGWVNRPNEHPFLSGASAMSVMLNGEVDDLLSIASILQAYHS